MSELTQLLLSAQADRRHASEQLIRGLYHELRRLAARQMANEACDHTLQPTALVHEAFLRLADAREAPTWESRGHFFAAAAEAMRRILIERARRKRRQRHGGQLQKVALREVPMTGCDHTIDLLTLNEALARFERESPQHAQLVKLRYFAGLTLEESAQAMGISRATACRYWCYAKAWLFDACQAEE